MGRRLWSDFTEIERHSKWGGQPATSLWLRHPAADWRLEAAATAVSCYAVKVRSTKVVSIRPSTKAVWRRIS